MSDPLFLLADHFGPLNSMLSDLSSKANEAYPEGGLVWSARYYHGSAHTIKIDGEYVARSTQLYRNVDLQDHRFLWSKLIWRASGNNETLMHIAGDAEWEAEENRLIGTYDAAARRLISLFQTSGASRVRMSFIDDETSLSMECVSLFGRDALAYSAFWSVD